jgi:hypothetical protein
MVVVMLMARAGAGFAGDGAAGDEIVGDGAGENGTAGVERTLTGEYDWGGRKSGDLEAVFTATGEDTWNVSFHFTFRDQPHVFSGTASGSLTEGQLRGEVFDDRKKRTFTFEGQVKDGKFEGSHAEIEGDRVQNTGTMTLS